MTTDADRVTDAMVAAFQEKYRFLADINRWGSSWPSDLASRELIAAALAPAPQAADAKPVARQWRALEDGFARISWELLGRGEEAGWRELAARLPQKYQIEERDLYAAPLSVPEGWVLVPKEPTPEMLGAWWRTKNCCHFHDEPPPTDISDYAAYRAMIAAAQEGNGNGRD